MHLFRKMSDIESISEYSDDEDIQESRVIYIHGDDTDNLPRLYNESTRFRRAACGRVPSNLWGTVYRCKEYPLGVYIDEYGEVIPDHPMSNMYKIVSAANDRPDDENEDYNPSDDDDDDVDDELSSDIDIDEDDEDYSDEEDEDEDEDEEKHNKAYYKNLVSQLKELKKKDDKEYNALVDKFDNCKERLDQCYEVLKSKNQAIPAEECGDIREAARAFLKDVLFRTNRLTSSSNPQQVKDLMKKVYNGIKKEMGFEEEGDDKLEFKEFHRIYSKKLMEYYSGLRSNVQSACKAAIMGKFSSRKSYMSHSQV